MRKIKRPTVELSRCSKCGGCLEVAPDIFRFSESGGYVEVAELADYDIDKVEEAMKYCPENCIHWEEE